MRALLIFLSILLTICNANAQTSAGQTDTVNSLVISWSVGELVVANYTNTSPNLSQGVIQPYGLSFSNSQAAATRKSSSGLEGLPASEIQEEDSKLTIYPNPSSGVFHLQWNTSIERNQIKIIVYDLAGQVVVDEERRVHNSNILMDLNGLSPGTYHLLIDDGVSLVNRRIIKR